MLTLQQKENNVQGLGWKRMKGDEFRMWGYSGRGPGVRAHTYFNPTTNTGIVVFINNDEGASIKLVKELYKTMIKTEANTPK